MSSRAHEALAFALRARVELGGFRWKQLPKIRNLLGRTDQGQLDLVAVIHDLYLVVRVIYEDNASFLGNSHCSTNVAVDRPSSS